MRDLFVTFVVFSALPFVLARPEIGIYVWSWLSYMNPHRLAWGFAASLPFAQMVAITLIISYLISKEPKKIPWTREVVVLLMFVIWMFITTLYSLYPEAAWPQWNKVWKIQLVTLLTLMLITSRARIHTLIWVIAVSLGFYGIKGGIWVLMTGGAHRVMGPSNTFIGENNEIGLALIMVVPIMWYLKLQASNKWARHGLLGATALTLVAIVGTHSRGALVGLAAMGLFFLLKSRQRLFPLILGIMFLIALPFVMPEHWFERMHTIETYEEDNSAMERLRAWRNATNLASERFLGGGYDALIFWGGRDAHSIYFEVLGEHGVLGLGLFLMLGLLTWMKASRVRKLCRSDPAQQWASDLMAMVQVSLIGYAAAGAFLGLAYFDLYYHLVAVVILSHLVVTRELAETTLAETGRSVAQEKNDSSVPPGTSLPARRTRHPRQT